MGKHERPTFVTGTVELVKAMAKSHAFTVAGGGDTIAAVERAGLTDGFDHLSMGGGAFLAYLERRELPGVAALTSADPLVTSTA